MYTFWAIPWCVGEWNLNHFSTVIPNNNEYCLNV